MYVLILRAFSFILFSFFLSQHSPNSYHVRKANLHLFVLPQNLSLLEQFSTRVHLWISSFNELERGRKRCAFRENRERERDGSRNDPPRRLLISLRVKTGWKRSRFLGVSGWQRWFFIALHENNLSSSFSLSLSCSHSLALFVLFSRLLWCPELKRARAEAFPVAEAARQISSPFVLPLARWQLVNSV